MITVLCESIIASPKSGRFPMESILVRRAIYFISWLCISASYSQSITLKRVDFRSDTVTKPSLEMRKAMAEAKVGDDVFEEDPSVNELEMRIASMFGKESSIFVPSGTMSNLIATMAWCGKRGSEMIIGDKSHICLYEQGGAAQIAGVFTRNLQNCKDGTIHLDEIAATIRSNNIHYPITELVAVENTHNFCGGKILPSGYIDALADLAWTSHGIPVHLDGARIWNAAAATGESLRALTAGANSVNVCLSKGLGAPVGSLLVGPEDFIKRARRLRKALGGGMRQAGVLAAAGLKALDDFQGGMIHEDHLRARVLAYALRDIPGVEIDVDGVQTNILFVGIEGINADELSTVLKSEGVLTLPKGAKTLRLVTHRDISDEDIKYAVMVFRQVAKFVANRKNMLKARPILGDPKQSKLILELDAKARQWENRAEAPTTIPEPEKILGSSEGEAESPQPPSPPPLYEEAVIHGMGTTKDGFCVFLRSRSNRVLRVVVTPSDPLSDGLDRQRAETPEAVTLLQLLQGIDVESHLARDALDVKVMNEVAIRVDMAANSAPPLSLSSSAQTAESTAQEGSSILEILIQQSSQSSLASDVRTTSFDESLLITSPLHGKFHLNSLIIDNITYAYVADSESQLTARLRCAVQSAQTQASALTVAAGVSPPIASAILPTPRKVDGHVSTSDAISETGVTGGEAPAASVPVDTAMPSADYQGEYNRRIASLLTSSESHQSGQSSSYADIAATLTAAADALKLRDDQALQSSLSSAADQAITTLDIASSNAFESIALALRYKSVILIASSLLSPENPLSYSLQEIETDFVDIAIV